MSSRESILRRIRDADDWITGDSMAESLGISRMAVSKQVATLKTMGYVIESAHRRGYRFLSAPNKVYAEEIRYHLETQLFGKKELHYFESIDSTNVHAREAALHGCEEGVVFIAETQTAGHGRRGRSWFSGAETGLCLSLVLRPHFAPAQLTLLPLLTAVAVLEAIEMTTGLQASVKWPNDLLLGGKKICGILTEASFDLETIDYIVIGVGLNVNTTAEQIPVELKDIATSLHLEAGDLFNRAALVRAFLTCFEERYLHSCANGFDDVMAVWQEKNCTTGHPVIIQQENQQIEGVAEGITQEGALILRTPEGGIEYIMSGDLSVRQQ